MPFHKSIIVKLWGESSKVLWLPNEWGIEKGDLIEVQCEIDGKVFVHTTKAKQNSSRFVCIPQWWPCAIGDIVDAKFNYVTLPVKKRPTIEEAKASLEDSDEESEED